jgi:hypothetical protein
VWLSAGDADRHQAGAGRHWSFDMTASLRALPPLMWYLVAAPRGGTLEGPGLLSLVLEYGLTKGALYISERPPIRDCPRSARCHQWGRNIHQACKL